MAVNFIWPAPGTTVITSGVGPRWGTNHNGLDISSDDAYGKPVVAAAAGKVTTVCTSGWGGGYGLHCYIDHGNGYVTRYAHMSKVQVTLGQLVQQGEEIGKIGSTGDSTGPHLHFEIRHKGAVCDPEQFVNPSKTAATTAAVKNRVKAMFTAYYPADNALEGGFLDALGNKLDPSHNTMAAPSCVAFHSIITIEGTGSDRDGQSYEVLDRGGAITVENGVYHFDILMRTEAECNAWGVKYGYAVISGTGSAGASGAYSSSGSVSADTAESEQKEITEVVVKSVTGGASSVTSKLTKLPGYQKSGVELLVQGSQVYAPCIEGDVVLERTRKGSPSKLTFTVVKTKGMKFWEGCPVSLRYNGKNVFHGYVFTKSRSDSQFIKCTAYDQIRYLKNKDTLSYTNKTYSELLKMIAKDYGLKTGKIADTKYKIPRRIEEGTLLDMLQNASDETVLNTGKLFVLYDDFGKLCLQNIESMKLKILVDKDTAQSFDYTSSIDKDVYNKIKLAVDNGDTGQREVYVQNDKKSQSVWGQLQYYEKLDSGATTGLIKAKSQVLLDFYNRRNRSLTVKGVFGDIRVRGGSSLVVMLNLGNVKLQNYMCVETVKHTFSPQFHTMDLTLVGRKGEFTA